MGFVWHQGAVQAGQVKVLTSYYPIDVEKEWGRLHVAILEREKLLRSEFERWEICIKTFSVLMVIMCSYSFE